jgi:hypothetical protein
MKRDTHLQKLLHPIPRIFSFPSESPLRELPPCFPTGSLWRERYSVTRTTGLSVYVCLPESPKKGTLLQNGEKHKVTIHRSPRRQKAYIQWCVAWFPKGIVYNTAISTPVPCSPWHGYFHLGLGKLEPH